MKNINVSEFQIIEFNLKKQAVVFFTKIQNKYSNIFNKLNNYIRFQTKKNHFFMWVKNTVLIIIKNK